MYFLDRYVPIPKGPAFHPSPVAKTGIPDFADSRRNPDVLGTRLWRDWWLEQIDYCINGYRTGGMWLPGRLYKYLNFDFITSGGRGVHYPDFVDKLYENAILEEEAHRLKMGIITLKGRRKGESEERAKMTFHYGLTFKVGYRGGIAAGVDTYAAAIFDKVRHAISYTPPELSLHYLVDDAQKGILATGWEEKSQTGSVIKNGSGNSLHYGTFKANPNKFKGLLFDDVLFEESGEFPLLKSSYNATKDCFMYGDVMTGIPRIQGTGGNIKRESADFQEFWYNAEKYKLIKVYVAASRMYYPCWVGAKNKRGDDIGDTKVLNVRYEVNVRRNNILGCEDVDRAKVLLRKRLADVIATGDKKVITDFRQNNPDSEADSFLQYTGNDFNEELLNHQLNIALIENRVKKYRLDYVKNEDGSQAYPSQVVATPAPPEEEHDFVWIYKHPITGSADLDIAGIDSYDQNKTTQSPSLGAMVVYRRANVIPDAGSRTPVALIYARPPRKEIFYENCLKAAIYYNLKYNVNGDIKCGLIIKHFELAGGMDYLAARPRRIETAGAKQVTDLWTSLTTSSKPRMVALMQSWVLDKTGDCWFPALLKDLLFYDTLSKQSDWDSADALGLALIQELEMEGIPISVMQDAAPKRKLAGWNMSEEGVWQRQQEETLDGYTKAMNRVRGSR